MAGQIKITFTGGSLLGEERAMALDGFSVIGRSHSAAVRLKEPDVSGKHIEFREVKGGVEAFCLSQNGFDLNGTHVSKGECRPVCAGDVLLLGSKVRIRIDAVLSGGRQALPAQDEATFATRAVEPGATATVATQFATPDQVVASVGETFATVAADAEAIAAVSPESIRGSVEEATFSEADSMAPAVPRPMAAMPPADDAPTQDEGNVETSIDAAADFGVPDDSTAGQTTGSVSGSADGETVEMKTRQASMDEIFRMKRMLEAKKRFRAKMVGFAAMMFFVVLGAVVFVNWPREERYLTHPLKRGTDKRDISQYIVKSDSGDIEMVVDYPNAPGMIKNEGEASIEVATFTGKRRNVPFRLSFVKKKDPAQLRLSLIQCAQAEMRELESAGYVFVRAQPELVLGREASSDVRFFEVEYPGWSQVVPQSGTRFFQCEYVKTEQSLKWHGFIGIIRKGINVYRLMREIPDDAWQQGRFLLSSYANLALYKNFDAGRWESPGDGRLLHDSDFDSIAVSVRHDLDVGRTGDWPRIGVKIDTLMAMSYSGGDDRRKTAVQLLNRLRKAKANCYNEFRMQYEIGRKEHSEAKMRKAFEACRGAFGGDPSDLRSIRVNNPEEWSCHIDR